MHTYFHQKSQGQILIVFFLLGVNFRIAPDRGDSTVGKTAVVQTLVTNGREFPKNYNMTLGVELNVKRFTVTPTDDVEMIIFDFTGLDLYMDRLTKFWEGAELLVLILDLTSQNSFSNVTRWHETAMSGDWVTAMPGPPLTLLFANKADLPAQRRVVSGEALAQLATTMDAHLCEGSAKENQGVEEAFHWLAEQWHGKMVSEVPPTKPIYDAVHKSALRFSSLSSK